MGVADAPSKKKKKKSEKKKVASKKKYLEDEGIVVANAGASEPELWQSFEESSFGDEIIAKLKKKFTAPTPIQAVTWPAAMRGVDVVGVAKTGSGKTLAFALPALVRGGKSCFLAPTRELAQQIAAQAEEFCSRVACVYGGAEKNAQAKKAEKATCIVATPGRLEDVSRTSDLLADVAVCVLDEADRMLDMGFEPQLTAIVKKMTRNDRQTLFFTATWPKAVRKLASKYCCGQEGDGGMITIHVDQRDDDEMRANKSVSQEFKRLDDSEKDAALVTVIDSLADTDKLLCFTNTKRRVDYLANALWREGYGTAKIHGDCAQRDREIALGKFKSGEWPLMFATDVAARGLDLPDVNCVVNFDMPREVEQYVHRIGRTGRAGKSGRAVTFFNDAYDIPCAPALAKIAHDANQPVPDWLQQLAKSNVKAATKLWKI